MSNVELEKDQDLIEVVDERATLMARADKLGISYSNNIGVETLRNRINEKLDELDQASEAAVLKEDSTLEARKAATKLIRVNITSMENTKNNMSGEIITVSNNVVGTIKRYIPYGEDWHVESIILDTLRDKMFQAFRTERNRDGSETRRGYSARAYGIQVLEPLTKQELADLKASQLARNSIEK
jgi:hypothetical protein